MSQNPTTTSASDGQSTSALLAMHHKTIAERFTDLMHVLKSHDDTGDSYAGFDFDADKRANHWTAERYEDLHKIFSDLASMLDAHDSGLTVYYREIAELFAEMARILRNDQKTH